MGIYLAKPSTEMEIETGTSNELSYSVGEMQGWRRNMEDAHISITDLTKELNDGNELTTTTAAGKAAAPIPRIALFGVFDGHGGKEVAKFVKLKYPNILRALIAANDEKKNMDSGNNSDNNSTASEEDKQSGEDVNAAETRYGKWLRESFHKIDEMLEDEQYLPLLRELRTLPNPCDAVKVSDQQEKEKDAEIEKEEEEETDIRNRIAALLGGIVANEETDEDSNATTEHCDDSSDELAETSTPSLVQETPTALERKAMHDCVVEKSNEISKLPTVSETPDTSEEEQAVDSPERMTSSEALKVIRDVLLSGNKPHEDPAPAEVTAAAAEVEPVEQDEGADIIISGMNSNYSGTKMVTSGTDGTSYDADIDADENTRNRNVAPVVMKRATNLSIQLEGELGDAARAKDTDALPSSSGSVGESMLASKDDTSVNNIRKDASETNVTPEPASIQTPNGMVCNLKTHRVLAGCTAVVAMIVGKKLIVANAGDSRGVLCRKDGVAMALSEDHKPSQDREIKRITSAGGFVNFVGRINGNLNLSRSLGDLKYKQLKHLSREDQIITAEPDITITNIDDGDRFFILACDGIWDCVSNQEACDFVSQRLDEGKSLDVITKEMLMHCLADDPRRSSGIGGDNMTFMVVRLNADNDSTAATSDQL